MPLKEEKWVLLFPGFDVEEPTYINVLQRNKEKGINALGRNAQTQSHPSTEVTVV